MRKKWKVGDAHRASLPGAHAVRVRFQSTQLPAERVPVDKESIVCGDVTEADRPPLGFL